MSEGKDFPGKGQWVVLAGSGRCYHRLEYGDQRNVIATKCGLTRWGFDLSAIRFRKPSWLYRPCRVCWKEVSDELPT